MPDTLFCTKNLKIITVVQNPTNLKKNACYFSVLGLFKRKYISSIYKFVLFVCLFVCIQ